MDSPFSWTICTYTSNFSFLSLLTQLPRQTRTGSSADYEIWNETHGMSLVKQQLLTKNLSTKTIKIIQSSWKTKTQPNYDSILKQWISFCNQQHICPSNPSVNTLLSFLTSLYERGLSYFQMNKPRSDIRWKAQDLGKTHLCVDLSPS